MLLIRTVFLDQFRFGFLDPGKFPRAFKFSVISLYFFKNVIGMNRTIFHSVQNLFIQFILGTICVLNWPNFYKFQIIGLVWWGKKFSQLNSVTEWRKIKHKNLPKCTDLLWKEDMGEDSAIILPRSLDD